MRESVRITAQREIAVAERQALVEAADEKVISNAFHTCSIFAYCSISGFFSNTILVIYLAADISRRVRVYGRVSFLINVIKSRVKKVGWSCK